MKVDRMHFPIRIEIKGETWSTITGLNQVLCGLTAIAGDTEPLQSFDFLTICKPSPTLNQCLKEIDLKTLLLFVWVCLGIPETQFCLATTPGSAPDLKLMT